MCHNMVGLLQHYEAIIPGYRNVANGALPKVSHICVVAKVVTICRQAVLFFKIFFFSLRNYICVKQFGPDISSPNCFEKLSADDTSR